MRLAVNFIAFQVGWFCCVLGAANGIPWLGPIVVTAVVALHLALSARPLSELYLVIAAMVLGLVADSLLLASGWLDYPGGGWFGVLAPYWIIAMWGLFATTLNVSMRWLRGRPLLGALFGAVGGPLSYFGGQKLGAMSFSEPMLALSALALTWALAMPLLFWLASRIDDVSQRGQARLAPQKLPVSSHV